MSLPVVFHRAALVEFDHASDWYEHRRAGLGAAFTASVQRVIDQIGVQTDFYPMVFPGMREALVPSFPYCVYFHEEPERVVVMSIFHTARDPSIWQSRVEK